MKIKTILAAAASAVFSLSAAHAQSTLTAWTFDNAAIGFNSSPAPSTGLGTASALGLSNSYNSTNSISNPDILSLTGSSTGGANSWRVRGFSSIVGSEGNAWSTSAPIGTQGAQFTGSVLGYYQIQVSFDAYTTTDSEANLQVQYTTDGSNYLNATIASAGSGVISVNSDPSNTNTVLGSYIQLATGWNNQITVNLTGLSSVANDANFGIRIVNASQGANCVNTLGSIYNNISGNWTLDNVKIQGVSIDTLDLWTFESEPNNGTIITNPAPDVVGAINPGKASSIGFTVNYGDGVGDISDVINTGGSSSGAAGPNAWRLRGGSPNGWDSAAPIGYQGSEFDVDTTGYSNIVVSFDIYFTTQAEAKMCVLYTTDGWITTNVANNLSYGGKLGDIYSNTLSANTVMGTYFFQTNGSFFYNDLVVDFTGNHQVENNSLFGFRIVNAATSFDCVNYLNGAYNNSSGNCRMDNIMVGGTAGSAPPLVAYDPSATVDGPFTNTFTETLNWRTNITAIYVNGQALTNTAYNISIAGEIVFTPAISKLLQSSGLNTIAILSKGYGTARVSQPIGAGVATQLAIINQPSGPTASGGNLVNNPFFLISDRYGNGTTNQYPNVTVTASIGGSPGWTLAGDLTQPSVNGLVAFTNLTATVDGSTAVSNAYISFAITGYAPETTTNSASFTVAAPAAPFTPGNLAVLQVDSTGSIGKVGIADNTTFSFVEINPSIAGQITPVNIVPVSASGTNGLRMATSGTSGRLALSDDGTLICFAAFLDNSAATPDETLNLNRVAAGMNYTNSVTNAVYYTSVSLGGSQARAAVILGDGSGSWIVDDKGGLYEGNAGGQVLNNPNLNNLNNVVVKSFGGVPYVETQKAVAGQNIPVVYNLGFDPDTDLYDVTFGVGFPGTDPIASDFYLISTNSGTTYDVMYINDQVSSTQGVIRKYSLIGGVGGTWTANGSFTNSTGVDGLFVTTNGNGGAYLFYTTGSGGSNSNGLVRVTDAAGWGAKITITSSNLLYQAPKGTSLKGLTFVPQQTAYTAELTPPPILTAQNGASVSSPFTVTLIPDVAVWRSAITGITVNGSVLSPSAYTVSAGQIVFNPAMSTLLQGTGVKSIVVSAVGFSQASVVQNITGVASPVVSSTLATGGSPTFSFTSTTGLTFSIHATNNVTVPLASWPVIGTVTEISSGHYQFTAPSPAPGSSEFYFISQP